MGCDIHSYAEVRNKQTGKWEIVGDVFKNPYYNPDRETSEFNKEMTNEPVYARNYDLFAILADVRNGRGFAGTKTGEGFSPISEPKGLPDDASDYVNEEAERWEGDGHSHSFFNVAELLAYDWDQVTMKQGYVDLEDYLAVRENGGYPASWCADCSGRDIVKIDENNFDKEAALKLKNEGKDVHVLYRWSISYREPAKTFLETTIPVLQSLGDPDDVRIVFWFDN